MTDHDDEMAAVIATSRIKADDNLRKFADGFRRDTRRWVLSSEEADFLARIATRRISGRALLSNRHVRKAAHYALMEGLVDASEDEPARQWLWITMAWDTGLTLERSPYIDFVSLRTIAYQHLRRSGIEGVGVVETDTWKNLTGEPGRRMASHVHFIGYPADGKRVKVTQVAADMRARAALPNFLDAPSVDIQNVSGSPTDFAQIGQYMLKPPVHAKNPVMRRKGDRHKFYDAEHAQGSTARLTEVFSHCELGDVLFSIGGGTGKDIASKVRAAVRHEIRVRAGAMPAPTREEVRRHWSSIRENNGSKKFCDCRIITRAEQRGAEKS
ncbi:hypothetical protein [Aurantiacibacter zhengii]|uniref:Replication protein n=1 Tax=Aurantiacibacter zhengii TaxID=2307003 RepID=A0A418NN41_9SPHN|nr:hypothetical protein [Aurantiacibacter zhengii]RIV82737.1 hypothetical protein D2V07_17520 [Aurantiacibacter zhengii]